MKDIVFRVALAGLVEDFDRSVINTGPEEDGKKLPQSKSDIQKIIFKGLDLIQSKSLTNLKEFNEYLKRAEVDQKEFADAVKGIIDDKKPERLVQLAMFLGEGHNGSGLDLLKQSWWERNLPDEVLRKILAPKFWKLFRNENWIQEHKVTKD